MAERVRRRSCGGVLPFGRHTSIRGSRRTHCPSLSIAPPHPGGAKRKTIQSVQATTRPSLKDGGEDILRAMLLDILEALHWTYQRKFHSRPVQKQATRNVVLAGIGAFIIMLLHLFSQPNG